MFRRTNFGFWIFLQVCAMSSSSRRVVLTGIGVANPIGMGVPAFWEGMCRGQNGIHLIQGFDVSTLPSRGSGDIVACDASNYIDK